VATVEFDSPCGARVNGQQAMSMVVLDYAVQLAIEKAQASHVAVVGTWNTSQSCGALGFYTEKIASAGLIGIVLATSPEFVAPFGAKQPILGTNPIACGVPTDR
jgi:L-2-hydroxycarboxylate dehydrogenase (NAD+)